MDGKHLVIVGGSHGIGRDIVNSYLAAGGHVSVFSRTLGELTPAERLRHTPLDVTTTALNAENLPECIDAFAYCPGSIQLGPLRSLKAEQMRADFELNTIGATLALQACLPGLKRAQGSAVFFSTVAVAKGLAMHTSIAAAKGALEALVRTWAAELAPSVRVNCVAPALTDTPLASHLLATDAKREAMAGMYPLRRIGTPQDIAAAAMYLLSDASSWVTGQTHHVDGGLSNLAKP